MKTTLIAASLLLLAVPAHAQKHGGGGMAPSQLNYGGGGGVGYAAGGGLGAVAFSTPSITRTTEHYNYIYAQGSDATFVPTRFVAYDAAVKMGKEALVARPKSIVEVAAECRAAKKLPK